jgi:ABC-type sugar transport system permease subunit
MKSKNWFVVRFLAPAMLCLLAIFLYPALRTILMSFNKVGFVTDNMKDWEFIGFANYTKLMGSPLFRRSLWNILKIWIGGGVVILSLSMLFSVIITSRIKGKKFWKAMLYLPHIISSVALVTMWMQYAYHNQYGLFKRLFELIHWNSMAQFQWTAPENLFLAMMIAYSYAGVGFYMLIMVAGIDGVSEDYYEASRIEGAGIWQQFCYITLPMLKDIIKRCIVLYSASAAGFFVYSTLFSFNTENATVTPMVYMYEVVFGTGVGSSSAELNVGAGAAAGVLIMLVVLIVNAVLNRIIPSEDGQ